MFSILLQDHISKLSRYFWSTLQSIPVQAPYKAVPVSSNLLVKEILFVPHCSFQHDNPHLMPLCILRHFLPIYPSGWNIPHSAAAFYLSQFSLSFDFVAFHTVVFCISIYCGPSNTTLCYQRCLIQQLTGRHVSVSRWPSSGPQELWLPGYMQRNIL